MTRFAYSATHRVIKKYYEDQERNRQMNLYGEGAVAPIFANLLRTAAQAGGWTLAEQYTLQMRGRSIRLDGGLLDEFRLLRGCWEAKDTADDLQTEVRRKFEAGYPRDNILFQSPTQVILIQNGREVFNGSIEHPQDLVEALRLFFDYEPPQFDQWEHAVEDFRDNVPHLAQALLELIRAERTQSPEFRRSFEEFAHTCREVINPNLSDAAVEEMLIQHLLTERLFRRVFENPDFVQRNVIAHQIETVIQALTSRSFSRADFLRPLDRFYGAIEATASSLDDFSQKQAFLNAVYEKFFQGFSVKEADVYGIVYTPTSVVNFMVRSVAKILQTEFGRSLGDPDVHILDPFVGTGTFIVQAMRQIPRTRLEDKYAAELHCNEVMLLPYYIASQNIEHTYYELTGRYRPFEGICLVDTFEDVRGDGSQLDLFAPANTERVVRQRRSPIFIILGNPPYNAHQVNANDNNRNRRYPQVDGRVAATYARNSIATNKNALSDMYVKAFRWASDRIGPEGVVAFITNNGFLDGVAFDGMRAHLEQDFSIIYHLDMRGNARTSGDRRQREGGNVFDDAIRVGIGITFLVRKPGHNQPCRIYHHAVADYLGSPAKNELLDQAGSIEGIPWQQLSPDARHSWLTEGLDNNFDSLLPLGTKAARSGAEELTIFEIFSNGVKTNRDIWAYNFNRPALAGNIQRMMETYNTFAARWASLRPPKPDIHDFITYDDHLISWSDTLIQNVQRGRLAEFDPVNLRPSLYRPYTKKWLYFDPLFNERMYQIPCFFPRPDSENRVISVRGIGMSKPFDCIMTNVIPDVQLMGNGQCFPFYTYAEDGTRRENITGEAVQTFQRHYTDPSITSLDIFHYVYGLLHHPAWRQRYAANLRRDLPHLPFAPDFWTFSKAGRQLGDLHTNYESQPEYPLQRLESNRARLSWRVEKMRLNPERTSIVYNDFLTLAGIPPQAFEYRLGNRSALDWVIEEYQVTQDKRSGIRNDPNREDDPQYIVKLIGKVVTVSLKTVEILGTITGLEIG